MADEDDEILGERFGDHGERYLLFQRAGLNLFRKPWKAVWLPAAKVKPELVAEWDFIPAVRPDDVEPPCRSPSVDVDEQIDEPGYERQVHYKDPRTTNDFVQGTCDDATKLPDLVHTTNVAACQSPKHLTSHFTCDGCLQEQKFLTQHEKEHMIKDKGLFPLCLACAYFWTIESDIAYDEEADLCVCDEELPQWMCVECWTEMAKIRSRMRDDADHCTCGALLKENSSETVRKCSGCNRPVAKREWETNFSQGNSKRSEKGRFMFSQYRCLYQYQSSPASPLCTSLGLRFKILCPGPVSAD